MRTITHALTDRLHFPRREIPRPAIVTDILAYIENTPVEAFLLGDIITFECAEGWRHVITILGVHPGGAVDAMVYNGLPHHFLTTAEAIKQLRVLRVERLHEEETACYRRLLELDPEIELSA